MWNYRVLHDTEHDTYEIVEAYYDDEESPTSYCAATVHSDNLSDLRWTLNMMGDALKKPALKIDQFTTRKD